MIGLGRPPAALAFATVLAVACGASRPPAPWREEDVDSDGWQTDHAVTPPRGVRSSPATAASLDEAVRVGRAIDIVVAASTLSAAGGDLARHRAAILDAVDRLGPDELAQVWPGLDPARPPAAAVAVRSGLLAAHRGDRAGAAVWLERARAAGDAADVVAAVDALARAIAAPPARAGTLAVLLPLTGRHAALGLELRAAIQLAIGALPSRPTLSWLDTGGDEARAAAMVDRAVDAGAVAILGPVGERESLAAARRAAERRIPIGLLAPDDGADPGAGVFRVTTSPADEARGAARLAAELDFTTVAVLAPRDDIGTISADAFVAAARASGLQVTAQGSYDPTARSLEPEVKAFLGLDAATNPRLREHLRRHGKRGWQTFSPDVPFSLLYVPDQHDRAALVASYLPYLGVELRTREIMDPLLLRRKHRGRIPQVVQLVGGSGWNHPGLAPRGGNAVDGAIILDVYAGALDAGIGGELAARYQDATGRAPSAAAAQAHDAALMVGAAVMAASSAREPRVAATAALARGRLEDGACGPAAISAGGEIERAPIFLEVDGGEIVLAPY